MGRITFGSETHKGRKQESKKKKKIIVVLTVILAFLIVVLILSVLYFHMQEEKKIKQINIKIDYGTSALYSKDDMDAAIQLIEKEFSGWKGCSLYSIRYTSDDCNNQETVDWMNELNGNKRPKLTQCIAFESDFHSPADEEEAGGLNPDSDYTDYQWWLGRTSGGKWKLLTWGY